MIVFSAAHATDRFSAAQVASIEKQLAAESIAPINNKGKLSDGQEYTALQYESAADSKKDTKILSELQELSAYASRCAVFKAAEGGELKLIGKSALIINPTQRGLIGCAVKNKLVLISVNGWSLTSGWSSVYKFSLIDNELVLIGMDNYYYSDTQTVTAEGEIVYRENISSYNILTGKGIHSVKKGFNWKGPEGSEFPDLRVRVIKPYQYKELKFNFKPYRKTLFSDFDFDKLNQHLNSQKNACGNFNEKLKFERCTEVN